MSGAGHGAQSANASRVEPGALSVLVLAGGAGRRMGGRKAEAELHGRRLVDGALDTARELGAELLVADGDARLELPAHARRVPDEPGFVGPMGGLVAGLAAARRPWCLLLPCDLLRPSAAVARALLERAASSARPAPGAPAAGGPSPPQAVVVVDAAGRQPFHALWATSALPDLHARLASGGRSMISLLDALRVLEVPASELDALDPTRAYLRDLDTPEDLSAARRGDPP